jgi:hypothetical protein
LLPPGIFGVLLANAKEDDPTYGGIFSTVPTPNAYNPDAPDYTPLKNKQDSFDWKLSKVKSELKIKEKPKLTLDKRFRLFLSRASNRTSSSLRSQ